MPLVALLIGSGSASGNGDIFFHLDVFDTSEIPIEEQVIFAGSVKDTDGNYLSDVTITITAVIATPRGDREISYNAYTNVIGRYRTLDVESVVLAFEEEEYDVDPGNVALTVEKSGYRTVRQLDRSRRAQTGGIFEVNFLMERTREPAQ